METIDLKFENIHIEFKPKKLKTAWVVDMNVPIEVVGGTEQGEHNLDALLTQEIERSLTKKW